MDDGYILQMEDIEKEYYGNRVLKGISLKLKPGEIMALVGENGAGTLSRSCGADAPQRRCCPELLGASGAVLLQHRSGRNGRPTGGAAAVQSHGGSRRGGVFCPPSFGLFRDAPAFSPAARSWRCRFSSTWLLRTQSPTMG